MVLNATCASAWGSDDSLMAVSQVLDHWIILVSCADWLPVRHFRRSDLCRNSRQSQCRSMLVLDLQEVSCRSLMVLVEQELFCTLGNHNLEVCWYWINRRFHVEVWWYWLNRSSTCTIGDVWIFYMGQKSTRINRVIVSVWRVILLLEYKIGM